MGALSGRFVRPTAFERDHRPAILWIAICVLDIILLVATGCASPTVPSSALGSISGVWQGQWQITKCDMSRGCAMIVGATAPYTMRLVQSGTQVDGVVHFWAAPVNVTGTRLSDGSVSFTGSKPAASELDPTGDGRITELALHSDPQHGFVGSFRYDNVHTPLQSGESSPSMIQGNILNATRTSLIVSGDASFAGHWAGSFVIRTCVPVGFISCVPPAGQLMPFDLRIDQSGSRATGVMAFQPLNATLAVTGIVASNRLVLDGDATSLRSGFPEVVRLTSWSTTRDDIGRMIGTFSYRQETHWIPPRPPVPVWTVDYDAELVGVVLQQQ